MSSCVFIIHVVYFFPRVIADTILLMWKAKVFKEL